MTQREQELLRLIEANPMLSQQELADALQITRSCVAVHISNLQKKGYIAGKGYVLRTADYAVVAGGVNVDIGGKGYAPLKAADSNPGTVSISLGGVGRNIAHNLALLGTDVRMLTAIGEDANGDRVAASCQELGIDIRYALRTAEAATSTYLYVAEPTGEMSIAISDMAICAHITPRYLACNHSILQNARVVVADTNLPQESLVYLAESCTAPLFCDPVSTAKAEKLRPILHRIHTLKPNALEAELLTGIPVKTPDDAKTAARALIGMGVKRVFLSLGSLGVCAADEAQCLFLPNPPCEPVNTTGCGDAFTAALVFAFLQNMDLRRSALAGLAAASIAMQSLQTINPAMSAQELTARIHKISNI